MPFRDQTGPNGAGQATGRGLGGCRNQANTPLQTQSFFNHHAGRGFRFNKNFNANRFGFAAHQASLTTQMHTLIAKMQEMIDQNKQQ